MDNFTEIEKWSLNQLVASLGENSVTKNKIVIPQYQRKLVWSKTQKKEFIDSIKMGFPVGSLLLFKNGSYDGLTNYALVDGLQRTTTIKEYMSNPTVFIEKGDIDDTVIFNIRKNFFNLEDDMYDDNIKNCLVDLLSKLKGFKESDGYSSYHIANNIINTLHKQNVINKDSYNVKELVDLLVPLKEKIQNDSDISSIHIPVIIYSGNENNLPSIFERINSKGTKLSKYEIFAASWFNDNLKINNEEIIKSIEEKYEALLDEGLEVENYSQDNFNNSSVTVFEYMFGLGKYLSSKYPYLFGFKDNSDSIDSIAFNLYSACLMKDVTKMHELPKKLKAIDYEKFFDVIIDCISIVDMILKPYIRMNFNKNKKLGYQSKEKCIIYHTEYQIISFIAKVYFMKYEINDKNDIVTRKEWKNTEKQLAINIPQHYLADIIRDDWKGTGNQKLKELIQEGSKYEKPISRNSWENILNQWFSQQLEAQEKSRVRIKNTYKLFLIYIYTHIISNFQDNSLEAFELDHIIPVDQLKTLLSGNSVGLPIGAVGNLCIIPSKLNKLKSNLNIYQYLDKQNLSTNNNKANYTLEQIEHLTFTTRDMIDYDKLTIEHYIDFINKRNKILLEKFCELNNIVD